MARRNESALLQTLCGRDDATTDSDFLDRFVVDRDENAFASLMHRYGRLVHTVARRVLGNTHDADDVLQATFLVLVRRAKSLNRGALGGWLHGVAYRLAVHLRGAQCKRTAKESAAVATAHISSNSEEIAWRDLRRVLDEELAQLPEHFRSPLILCYLDGLTQDEAAQRLGWKKRTLKARLETARRRLHSRLDRRGLTLSAALTGPLLAGGISSAGMPVRLVAPTVRIAMGGSTDANLSPQVLELVHYGVRIMSSRLLSILAITFAAVSLTGFGVLLGFPNADPEPKLKPLAVGQPAPAANPLPDGPRLQIGSPRFRHHEARIALSKDGNQLITFTNDTVRLWDSSTGKLLRELGTGSKTYSGEITWAPDGKTFISAESVPGDKERATEYFLRVRDAESGKVIRSIPYLTAARDFEWTPVRYLASGKEVAVHTDSGISIRDLKSGAELIQHKFTAQSYCDFGVSGNGKRLAVVGGRQVGTEVLVWDWESGREPRTFKITAPIRFRGVVVSHDGKRLALFDDREGLIKLVDADNGQLLREFRKPERLRVSRNVVFSPDGKKLLAADDAGFSFQQEDTSGVIVWEVETGNLIQRLQAGTGAGNVAVSADGRFVASGADGFPIWELATGKRINPVSNSELLVADRAVVRGDYLLTLSYWQPACLWDTRTGGLLHVLPHKGQTRAGTISADGRQVATSANDGTIKVWEIGSGKLIYDIPSHDKTNAATALQFSADGRKLVSFGADFNLRTTDLSNGKTGREFAIRWPALNLSDPRSAFKDTTIAYSAAISPDGSQLVLRGRKKTFLFDTDTGREMRTLDVADTPTGEPPSFSPDGTLLLMMGKSESVAIPLKGGSYRNEPPKENPLMAWDMKTGRKRWEVMIAGNNIRLAFAPDGRTFVAAKRYPENTDTVEFRDSATGKFLGKLDRLSAGTRDVAFSHDCKRVVLVMDDGIVLVYAVPDLKTSK